MAAHTAATDAAIDCDVHPALRSMGVLMPYLEPYWRETFAFRGIDKVDLSLTSDPRGTPLHARPDWRQPGGDGAADVETLRRHLLDPFGLRLAILNCMHAGMVVFSEDMGAAICRAANDWLAQEWLDRDDRLRAAITVPLQGPELAVAEIERRAADRRFVQVLVPVSNDMPLGRRRYWPVWRAAQTHGLPVAIHVGSAYRQAPTSTGWPTYFLEDYVAEAQAFESALLSMLSEGVFEEFPDLRVVLAESGVAWLPSFIWRANKTWRGVRAEIPWANREPGEVIRRQVRLTTQPLDLPEDAARVQRFLEQVGSDDMLLFSTDYPHWQFDGTAALTGCLPAALRQRIMVDNPLRTFPRLTDAALWPGSVQQGVVQQGAVRQGEAA